MFDWVKLFETCGFTDPFQFDCFNETNANEVIQETLCKLAFLFFREGKEPTDHNLGMELLDVTVHL